MEHRGLDPEHVYLTYLECGGNRRETARRLGISEHTVRWHVQRVPPATVRGVRISVPAGTDPARRAALDAAVRTHLVAIGVIVQ